MLEFIPIKTCSFFGLIHCLPTHQTHLNYCTQGRPLSEEEYMDLGEKQCRLTPSQRKIAYDCFLSYNSQMESSGLWDDCDRADFLLRQLQGLSHDSLHELQYNRVYVDEIQDYTQSQLATRLGCKQDTASPWRYGWLDPAHAEQVLHLLFQLRVLQRSQSVLPCSSWSGSW